MPGNIVSIRLQPEKHFAAGNHVGVRTGNTGQGGVRAGHVGGGLEGEGRGIPTQNRLAVTQLNIQNRRDSVEDSDKANTTPSFKVPPADVVPYSVSPASAKPANGYMPSPPLKL